MLGDLITSAKKYGTKVNYEANGVNDWKVFYKQTTGYYVNDITNGDTTGKDTEQDISARDSLYIWSTVSNSSIWLASPSAYYSSYVLTAYYKSTIAGIYYNNEYIGVRSVVCISANIPASMDANGNIEI